MLRPSNIKSDSSIPDEALISTINLEDSLLLGHFDAAIQEYPSFSRSVVSFQANKKRPAYRWYKFKEAFSASLIEFFLENCEIKKNGLIFDPFAGSGTSLFASQSLGCDAEGIELLPIGQQIIMTRKTVDERLCRHDIVRLKKWLQDRPWEQRIPTTPLNEIKITTGAYPEETKRQIEQFIAASESEKMALREVLRYALLCVLEDVSYTRKDGQYLRWDYRSNRTNGAKVFSKGDILSFSQAISRKMSQILTDVENPLCVQDLFPTAAAKKGTLTLHSGSCLDILPGLPNNRFDAVITSPPYCNRYDYTRTYALELALLGATEKDITSLRQKMLSCTVENREKDLLAINDDWSTAISIASDLALLQDIISFLEQQKSLKKLNNNGIPRMVKGYFYEMACVIQECFRVLKSNSPLIMVNDNVRYAGVSISVDLILSKIAEEVGFNVEKIYVLPGSKGNSSQQMGNHGRQPLRKCVYLWRKP